MSTVTYVPKQEIFPRWKNKTKEGLCKYYSEARSMTEMMGSSN